MRLEGFVSGRVTEQSRDARASVTAKDGENRARKRPAFWQRRAFRWSLFLDPMNRITTSVYGKMKTKPVQTPASAMAA